MDKYQSDVKLCLGAFISCFQAAVVWKHRCWNPYALVMRLVPFVTSPVNCLGQASTKPDGCSLALSVSLPLTKASNKRFRVHAL